MKLKIMALVVLVLAIALAVDWHTVATQAARQRVVRCAVIGGMTMTGLWEQISKMFEAQSGYRVEVVATASGHCSTGPSARAGWICSRCTRGTLPPTLSPTGLA